MARRVYQARIKAVSRELPLFYKAEEESFSLSQPYIRPSFSSLVRSP